MSDAPPTNILLSLLRALEPHTGPRVRAEREALEGLLSDFRASTLVEIRRQATDLRKASGQRPDALLLRARAQLTGDASEPVEALEKDLKSLKVTDLRSLGSDLGLTLKGSKGDCLAALVRFLQSRGADRPPSATDAARPYLEEARESLRRVDAAALARLRALVARAFEDPRLGKEGFEALAGGIGLRASGSKAKVRDALLQFLDRLGVSHDQTRF